jgi:AmmeMemoRadiSam system protein B
VRRSTIAGSWYPGTARALTGTIRDFLANVELEPLPGRLVALIAPHAGYVYSGQVAAHAYRYLEGSSHDRVIVISPVHRAYVGRFAVTSADSYETPLGKVPVDGEFVDALARELQIQRVSRDNEHSLEIQIPFLQHTLGEFRLTPIMMGEQGWDACARLADALVKIVDGVRVLLVASTDLSHFHAYRDAQRLDSVVVERIRQFDPEGLSRAMDAGRCEACGGGPVVATMLAGRSLGAEGATILKYANSGDVTGDQSSVVGYLAAALHEGQQSQ